MLNVRLVQPKGSNGRGSRIFVDSVEIPGVAEFSATLTADGTQVTIKLASARVEWIEEPSCLQTCGCGKRGDRRDEHDCV